MRIPGTDVHVYSPFNDRNRADRRNREAAINAAANPAALPPRREIPQPAPVRRVLGVAMGGRLPPLPALDGGPAAARTTAQVGTQTYLQPFMPPAMRNVAAQAGPSTCTIGSQHSPSQTHASMQHAPQQADVTVQTVTDQRSIGIQHDGSRIPRVPRLPPEVMMLVAASFGRGVVELPDRHRNLATFRNLSLLSRSMNRLLHPIVQHYLLARATARPSRCRANALLETIGSANVSPSIRSLPAVLQERPLVNLVILMASHNYPFVHDATRRVVLPHVLLAIAALPRASVERILTMAFARSSGDGGYDEGRMTFSALVGNPEAPRLGTIAGLDPHRQLGPLRQAVNKLYPSLPPNGPEARAIATLVNNLPEGVGDDLKKAVRPR